MALRCAAVLLAASLLSAPAAGAGGCAAETEMLPNPSARNCVREQLGCLRRAPPRRQRTSCCGALARPPDRAEQAGGLLRGCWYVIAVEGQQMPGMRAPCQALRFEQDRLVYTRTRAEGGAVHVDASFLGYGVEEEWRVADSQSEAPRSWCSAARRRGGTPGTAPCGPRARRTPSSRRAAGASGGGAAPARARLLRRPPCPPRTPGLRRPPQWHSDGTWHVLHRSATARCTRARTPLPTSG